MGSNQQIALVLWTALLVLVGRPEAVQAQNGGQDKQLARPATHTARLCFYCRVYDLASRTKPREEARGSGKAFRHWLKVRAPRITIQLNVPLFSWQIVKNFPYFKAETPRSKEIRLWVAPLAEWQRQSRD